MTPSTRNIFSDHKCSVLNTMKVHGGRTILYCVECGNEVGEWIDKVTPGGKQEFSAAVAEQMK